VSGHSDGLESLLDRPIAFHRCFVTLTGSVQAALMLSQAVYWSRRTRRDGWFYKSRKEWQEETGLTRHEQDTARIALKKTGFWQEELRGVPATMHFRVAVEKLLSSLSETGKLDDAKPANLLAGKRQTLLLSETTTETTSENLRTFNPSTCGKAKATTPQQRTFGIVGRLTEAAEKILEGKPHSDHGDVVEELKQWAADHRIPYFAASHGASPIEQAITIALERTKRKTA
jgi:hypothetical protein